MDDAESRITAGPQYLRVDFGSCDRLELSATYRSFADLCLGKRVKRALLQAGDNEPEGHNQLREALVAMARAVAIPPDFKLALVASTPPIAAVYCEAQQLRMGDFTWMVYGARNFFLLRRRARCARRTAGPIRA
jgi:hypothetical protein